MLRFFSLTGWRLWALGSVLLFGLGVGMLAHHVWTTQMEPTHAFHITVRSEQGQLMRVCSLQLEDERTVSFAGCFSSGTISITVPQDPQVVLEVPQKGSFDGQPGPPVY